MLFVDELYAFRHETFVACLFGFVYRLVAHDGSDALAIHRPGDSVDQEHDREYVASVCAANLSYAAVQSIDENFSFIESTEILPVEIIDLHPWIRDVADGFQNITRCLAVIVLMPNSSNFLSTLSFALSNGMARIGDSARYPVDVVTISQIHPR